MLSKGSARRSLMCHHYCFVYWQRTSKVAAIVYLILLNREIKSQGIAFVFNHRYCPKWDGILVRELSNEAVYSSACIFFAFVS